MEHIKKALDGQANAVVRIHVSKADGAVAVDHVGSWHRKFMGRVAIGGLQVDAEAFVGPVNIIWNAEHEAVLPGDLVSLIAEDSPSSMAFGASSHHSC